MALTEAVAGRPGIAWRGWVSRYAVVIVAVVLFIGFSVLYPDTFATTGNLKAMVNTQSVVLLLALGASIPILVGDIDFSVSAVMTGAAALLAALTIAGVPVLIAVLAALVFGLVVGAVNAFFIVSVGVDSLVLTLGSLIALGGMAYAATGSQILTGVPHSLVEFSRHEVFGLPAATWYAWILVVVVWYVYERTPLGRYLLFTGGNPEAARLSGLPVARLRAGALIACALIAAFAGIVLLGQMGAADPGSGPSYLLQPFAAIFLGATAVKAGQVNAWGTMIALYLLTIGITGMQLAGAQAWVNNVFNGLALILAITVAKLASGKANR
ncbi:ABC transporter permease [Amycolatopsis jejuensis]|uniref:ABC transporter permease n=1 Tax=Amycolatopsis jejuensis TaxID=330084 RepID=UPI0005240F41|nr:ABC transporter permease [Amycolatopsis jejuensis]